MAEQKDIFISYGRGNEHSPGSKVFALELCQELEEKGYTVWLDKNDIPMAVDFQQEIEQGISQSDNFIFIISPHAVRSMHCFREIQYALRLNKRLIPILHIDVDDGTVQENMHPKIKKLNWLPFNEEETLGDSLQALLEVVETDREYVSKHSRYTSKALEWNMNEHKKDFLLRGQEMREAKTWLADALSNKSIPKPTQLQKEFVNQSEKAIRQQRFQRWVIASFTTVVLLLMSVALYMTVQRNSEAKKALIAQQEAFDNFRRSQSNQIIAKAGNSCLGDPFEQLRAAILAYRIDSTNLNAVGAVIGSYYNLFPPEALYEGTLEDAIATESVQLEGSELVFETGEEGITLLTLGGEKVGQIDVFDARSLALEQGAHRLKVSLTTGYVHVYDVQIDSLVARPFPEKTLADIALEESQEAETVAFAQEKVYVATRTLRPQKAPNRKPRQVPALAEQKKEKEVLRERIQERRETIQQNANQISLDEIKKYGIDKKVLEKSGVKVDSSKVKKPK